MTPTPQQAWELLCEYNAGEFHRKHSRIVGDVLRWYAETLGYGGEADFWEAVGILHDLDFEQWPEQHCLKEQEPLPLSSELLQMENVVATPHTAASTNQSVRNCTYLACQGVIDALLGRQPVSNMANRF